jgi:hypothetical protein
VVFKQVNADAATLTCFDQGSPDPPPTYNIQLVQAGASNYYITMENSPPQTVADAAGPNYFAIINPPNGPGTPTTPPTDPGTNYYYYIITALSNGDGDPPPRYTITNNGSSPTGQQQYTFTKLPN